MWLRESNKACLRFTGGEMEPNAFDHKRKKARTGNYGSVLGITFFITCKSKGKWDLLFSSRKELFCVHKVKSDRTCSYIIFTYTRCYCPFLDKCGDAVTCGLALSRRVCEHPLRRSESEFVSGWERKPYNSWSVPSPSTLQSSNTSNYWAVAVLLFTWLVHVTWLFPLSSV